MVEQDLAGNVEQSAQQSEPEQDQAKMMEELEVAGRLHKGQVVTGKIVKKIDGGWMVDVGFKSEGFLPEKEWTHRILVEDSKLPEVGGDVTVQVTNIRDGEEVQLVLSRWRNELDTRWHALEDKLAENEIVEVKGERKVKGGLMVACCGLEGFVPMSHITANGRGANLNNFIDKNFNVKLLQKDKKTHRLLFSRKDILAQELAEKRARFYEAVHVGDIVEGEVSSITDFGVFVTIGDMDGLVHVSELSWKRSIKIRDMFKKGDKVTVKVIGIDQEKDRISLSIKQVQGDPWQTVSERIHKGDVIKGQVTNITDFGAFVEIEPGVEGLIHIGDISWSRIQHPREKFKKGQEVEAVVLDVAPTRISLGYKQLNDPWRNINERYQVGQDIKVKVVRLAEFGAFVEAEPGVEALIHISQLSSKRVEKPADIVKEGDEVTARILEITPDQRRMRLSLKALEPEPEPAPEAPAVEAAPEQAGEPAAQRPARPRFNNRPAPREGANRPSEPKREKRRSRPAKPQAASNRQNFTDNADSDAPIYNPFVEAFKNLRA